MSFKVRNQPDVRWIGPRLTRYLLTKAGLLLLVTVFLSGCGSATAKRLAISGTITLDGKLVGPVLVTLVPTQAGQVGSSFQSSDGHFQVPAELGPSAGQFDVLVTSLEPDLEEFEQRRLESQSPLNGTAIPAKYQTAGALTVQIAPEENSEVLLALVSN